MLSPQAELYSAYDSKCLKIELTYCLGSEPYIHKIHYLPKKLVLDEKIEVLTALKNGKKPEEIPKYYAILEKFTPDQHWD